MLFNPHVENYYDLFHFEKSLIMWKELYGESNTMNVQYHYSIWIWVIVVLADPLYFMIMNLRPIKISCFCYKHCGVFVISIVVQALCSSIVVQALWFKHCGSSIVVQALWFKMSRSHSYKPVFILPFNNLFCFQAFFDSWQFKCLCVFIRG